MRYLGSKSRIAKYLVPIIQSYVDNPECKGYIESHVGGANVIDKIKCDKKYGFDNHKYLIALLQQTQKDTSVFPEIITEELYKDVHNHYIIKDNKYEDWFIGLVGFCSFGSKWFGGFRRSYNKDGTLKEETAGVIRNLIKQAPNLKDITFRCRDFRTLNSEKINGYVIYNDIPYRNSTKYSTGKYPYEEFYNWCRVMSKNNIVLTSEYWMPDDFECIWQGNLKCTLDKNSRTDKVEKLFKWKGI